MGRATIERGGDEMEEKIKNWISVNLPDNCPNVCISFKRDIAEIQIKKFGAKPLYGFDNAWRLEKPQLFKKPIPASGKQGLWNFGENVRIRNGELYIKEAENREQKQKRQ